jgi:hypothetical protein
MERLVLDFWVLQMKTCVSNCLSCRNAVKISMTIWHHAIRMSLDYPTTDASTPSRRFFSEKRQKILLLPITTILIT